MKAAANMDATRLLRLGAAGVVVLVIALTALQLRRPAPPEPTPWAPAPARPADPRSPALARCQALGETGARDPGCLAVWAETRRRFLGLTAPPAKD